MCVCLCLCMCVHQHNPLHMYAYVGSFFFLLYTFARAAVYLPTLYNFEPPMDHLPAQRVHGSAEFIALILEGLTPDPLTKDQCFFP